MKKHIDKLKNFDAYYKPVEDLQERTFIGGTVSILCWITIFFLSSLRTYEYVHTTVRKEAIYVDSSRSSKIMINIDFIFPRVSCDYLSLDAMDSSGEQHLHIDHNIFKRRLDLNGTPIAEPTSEKIAVKTTPKEIQINITTSAPQCGSCYGAEDPSRNITCCNTCEEVKEAYRLKRWSSSEEKFEQCKSSATSQQIQRAFKEGCQIYGYMEVNRVAGSFHIAPGKSSSFGHMELAHVHVVQPFKAIDFNTSHHIRHLSFGNNKIAGNINPLDNTHSIATSGAMMYNYYVKIVPTLFVNDQGETFEINQISVTKYEKALAGGTEMGMPGVFFNYELSALMVKITEQTKPISHLITDICSIVGGVWIVCMFIDSIFYRSSQLLNKIELGKAS